MDHSHAPAGSCCAAFAEKRRKIEPYFFFFGLLSLIGLAIALVTCEAYSQVGPDSAQSAPAHHH